MNKKVYVKRLCRNKITIFDCVIKILQPVRQTIKKVYIKRPFLNAIKLFDSSEFNLACTRTTRNVRNSRNGFASMCNLSHEKGKI